MRARVLLGLALTALLPKLAFAGDWRYCVAPSRTDHKIYMTAPFPADTTMNDAESEFARALAASGLRYDDVQCPRSDAEADVLSMQQHAIDLNREVGNEVISLHWTPGE